MKRVIIAGAAGIAAVAAVTASAASLGGFTGQDVGADTDIVASCTTSPITVSYDDSYSIDDSAYVVESVLFAPVADECQDLSFAMTLADDSGVPIVNGQKSGTVSNDPGVSDYVADDTFTVILDPPISAELIDNVALIIQETNS